MKRTWSWILSAFSAALILSSCGGDTPTNPTGPPAPAATATPTPATPAPPAATATPVPTPIEPDEDDNPGPVTSVFTRVFVARNGPGGAQRVGPNADQFPGTPYYDPVSNTEVVLLGEFFILDTTPKNAQNQKCQAQRAPEWVVQHNGAFEPLANNGIGSNPFQYRANARRRGVVEVYTFVDGVRSNVISVTVK